MKRITAAILVILMLLCAFSACKKADEKNSGKSGMKTLDDLRSSSSTDDDDLNARREEAAKQSGNKLNEKIKEAEKNKNKKDDNGGSNKDSKDNSGNSSEGKNGAGSATESLAQSSYVSALSKEDLEKTFKLAFSFVRKKYDKTFDSKKLLPADDKCDEYNKYVMYGIGNVIIYEGEIKGKTTYIAVGRYTKDSEWKVLNKK